MVYVLARLVHLSVGISVSKHIFTLCCIAAELNALSPSVGHWLQTIQFSTITLSLIFSWCVGGVQVWKMAHCIDAIGSLWKLCRMCMDSLIIVSFALLPLWISTVNVCPLHSILIFGSVCLGQFNYWEHPPNKCVLDTILKLTFHAMSDYG